jgi:hypothetical protein
MAKKKKPSVHGKSLVSSSLAQNRANPIATIHPSKASSLRRERAYEKLNPDDVVTFQEAIEELERDFEDLSTTGQASPRL